MPRYTVENTIAIGRNPIILLNGEPARKVVEADTDEGWIVCVATKKNGDLVIDRKAGEILYTPKQYGKVEVIFPDEGEDVIPHDLASGEIG